MTSTFRQRLLASTLLIGAAALAAPAWAQQAPPPPPVSEDEPPPSVPAEENAEPAIGSTPDSTPGPTEMQQTEEGEAVGNIIVTGSRIARPDLTSSSPMAVVNDEEFKLSGAVNVEQVLNTLPQVAPGGTAFSNNPGGGVATINLRGLGSTRNLVLVNGRRYIFFGTSQVVDVNTVPAFLIDSVDVVTGGASAVYGSDAIAGVVNFKLRGVRGFETGAQVNITERGDGLRWNINGAIGTDVADGRGNITLFGEYLNRGSIFQGDRAYSEVAYGDAAFFGLDAPTGETALWGEPTDGLIPFGSAGVPQGRFVAPASVTIGGVAYPIASGTNYPGGGAFFATPGTSRPYSGTTDTYNYAPVNYLMVPQERWTLGGYGDFEISDLVTAYMEANFVNNRVENELAATPITQTVNFPLENIEGFVSAADFQQLQLIAQRQQVAIAACAATPGCVNPFGPLVTGSTTVGALQPGEVRLTVNSRTTGIGERNASDDRNAFRLLGGFKGNITPDLTYDLYYMYARTRLAQIQEGNVSRSAFTEGLQSGLCNPFGADQMSPECIDSISILAQNSTTSALQVAQGSIAGSLFALPWTVNPIGFAAGAEYRDMAAEFIPDTALSSGDVAGFNAGQGTKGSYDVKELFGEVRIPIVDNNFIHRLSLNGAGRYSKYSLDAVGGVWTYAAGAELAPIRDVTFRAQYQRAVRAPNVAELFGGQSVGFPPASDPCAQPGAATNAAVRDVCIATGVPASNVGQSFLQPNSQIQGAFGGNPNLEEEVSDTFTAGVVLRPSFIPRLNVTVDYYDIKVDNVISVAGGGVNNILNLCYNVIQDASSSICQLIARDPQGIISGPPYVVTATNANLANLESKGIDFQVDYSTPLGFSLTGAGRSRLAAFFIANRNLRANTTPLVDLPDDVIKCVGKFGFDCGDPGPKWNWSSRLSLQDGPVTTSLRWRHLGSVRDDDPSTDYALERIGAYNLFDLAFAFDVHDSMSMNVGVNNLLDKQPPVLGFNQEQANTYPSAYHPIGRDFFVSTRLRF